MCVHRVLLSLDHYTRAQPRIDWGTRLRTVSFEASQPDGVETVFSHSDGFVAVQMTSKWAGQCSRDA